MWGLALLAYLQQRGLAVASVKIMPELGLSQVELGWLETAFLDRLRGHADPRRRDRPAPGRAGDVRAHRHGRLRIDHDHAARTPGAHRHRAVRGAAGRAVPVRRLAGADIPGVLRGLRGLDPAAPLGARPGHCRAAAPTLGRPSCRRWSHGSCPSSTGSARSSGRRCRRSCWRCGGAGTGATRPPSTRLSRPRSWPSWRAAWLPPTSASPCSALWRVLKNRDVLLLTFAYAVHELHLLSAGELVLPVPGPGAALRAARGRLHGERAAAGAAAVGATVGGLLAAPLVRRFGLRGGLRSSRCWHCPPRRCCCSWPWTRPTPTSPSRR